MDDSRILPNRVESLGIENRLVKPSQAVGEQSGAVDRREKLKGHADPFTTGSSLVKNEIGPDGIVKADSGVPCIGLEPMTR